jgi:hypothetical protein
LDVGVYGRLSIAKRADDLEKAEGLTELAIERQHERVIAYCQARDWKPVRFYADIDSAYPRPGRRSHLYAPTSSDPWPT